MQKSFPPGLMNPGGEEKQLCFVSKLSRRLLDVRTTTAECLGDRAHSPPRGGHSARMASPPRRGARARAYTYTPTFLRRALPRPLLGFRAAGPGPEPLVGSLRPARARRSTTRPRAGPPRGRRAPPRARSRAVPPRASCPPSFFPGEPSRPASPSPATSEPGVEDAVVALRSLARVEEVPAPRTAPRSATGARSSRSARARAGTPRLPRRPRPRAPRARRARRERAASRPSARSSSPRSSRARGPGTSARAQTPRRHGISRAQEPLRGRVRAPHQLQQQGVDPQAPQGPLRRARRPETRGGGGPRRARPAPLRALSENEFPEPRAPGKRRASSSAPRALAPAY